MNIKSAFSLLRTADHKTWAFLAIAGLGLLSLAVGSYFTYETHFRHPQYSYLPVDEEWQQHLQSVVKVAQAAENGSEQPITTSVVVDVSGAVEKPGVYQLSTPARFQDAVLMAGGFQKDADQRYVHQELNLAAQVSDQEKIYIPFAGESVAQVSTQESQPSVSGVTVNTADAKTLQSIDGIGEKRAESIIAGRPYSSEADFTERAGLSQALAETVLRELKSFE